MNRFIFLALLLFIGNATYAANKHVKFDFTQPNNYEMFGFKDFTQKNKYKSKCTLPYEGATTTKDNISLTVSGGKEVTTPSGTTMNTSNLYYYPKGKDSTQIWAMMLAPESKMTFSVASGKKITKISVTTNTLNTLNAQDVPNTGTTDLTDVSKKGGTVSWTPDNSTGVESVEWSCTIGMVISSIDVEYTEVSTIPEGSVDIAGFKALPSGTVGTLYLKDAKILAMNDYKNKIYVRDASSYILLYKVDQLTNDPSLKVGAVLNGTIKAMSKPYWDTPELQSVSEYNVVVTPSDEAPVARKMKVSEIKKSDINDLVQIDGSIEYQNAKDETGSIKLYNGYLMPQTQFPDGKNKIIQGIVGIYKGTLEIFPTSIKDGIVNGINGVNAQNDENAPIYNLAGQRVNKSYKGVVIRNGKKYIQR